MERDSTDGSPVTDAEGDHLNVAAWQPRSVANGPGERFVLWVQGCPFRCPGCYNQDFLPNRVRHRMPVEAVARMVERANGIEGITYSGGEPFAQAEALFRLTEKVKSKGLTVVSYSGYYIEELHRMADPWVRRLISVLDVLIDGRYDEDQRAVLPWRGSRNQRVHFLTDRYRYLTAEVDRRRSEVEFIVGSTGFVTTGILNETFVRRLEVLMNDRARQKGSAIESAGDGVDGTKQSAAATSGTQVARDRILLQGVRP